ncbi:MAG: orotate phosphoribosyltransferase [Gammaproteobacteria bacterium]|nr:orotate phosphoribosyltransferase [Gammaproteobacteria bacterium]
MPFVDDQGKEALNFQITMLIAFIISFVLMFILIGFVLMGVVAVFDIVMLIIASIKANEGVRYRYPYAIRLIK